MPEQLLFTKFLNHYLAGPVTALLNAIHLPPANPQAPITNFVSMELLVTVLLLVFFVLVRRSLSVESPSAVQHFAEFVEGFIKDQSEEIIGHHSEIFVPFLVTLGLFILMGNLIGLVPGFESPTANVAVPFGCAIAAWFYYHFHGIKRHGPFKYAKQFVGPLGLAGAVLMIPIEMISHLARLLSLTVRLWANMYAGDLITLVILSMVPIFAPVIFLGLHIFVSLLQTYIFVLLATVYLAGAVAEEH
jgi:F-type H+-transporting ATPase subunit a